jgi:ATP-dependent protease HslVU (ClpYQ) peptidase subunit
MSVIVVKKTKDKVIFASDSQTTAGWKKQVESKKKMFFNRSKIFEVNNMVIGCAGAVVGNTLMQIFAKNHTPKTASEDDVMEFMVEFEFWAKKKDVGFNLSENAFLIFYLNEVFEVCDGLLVSKVGEFAAIGSGSFLALGALYFNHTAQEAVEVAKEYDLFCSGDTVTIEKQLCNTK